MWRKGNCTLLVNWSNHNGKQYGDSVKKLGIQLSYDPAVLLDVYTKNIKMLIHKDMCTPMFIAILFTIAKM